MDFFALLLLIPLVFLSYRIWHYFEYRKNIHLIKYIDALFLGDNPTQVSCDARLTLPHNNNLLYGEVSLHALWRLLKLASPRKNQIFYDLGSGCGKVAAAVKLKYPTLIVKGIEQLPELHKLATKRLKAFELQLICDNFLNYDISDANIIFINATGFICDWDRILQKLFTLKSKTKIIITSKKLPATFFNELYSGMEYMSWGLTSTYIYEKI